MRIHHTGDPYYRFLDWNLFLAWIPLALGLAANESSRRGHAALSWLLGLGWLLFFPNAPYMLTDFIHLGESQAATPLWYDGLMLSSFAWTALLLGFVSLYFMQSIWVRALGAGRSWAGVIAALAFASVGVYIGRFVQYNSWDALLHPVRVGELVLRKLENPFRDPRFEASLFVLTGFLLVAYAVFYNTVGLRLGGRGLALDSREDGASRSG